MTEYVTTCDGGVPLDTPVTSPPFFALIEPMEGRRDSATTGGPPRMALSLGRSSHPPRLVCAGAWAAEHRAVRRLQRRWEGEASGHPVCSCCSRISCGVGPSRYPQGAH